METALIIALLLELSSLITISTALQRNSDDGKAWIIAACNMLNICMIGSVLIHYLMYVYPIIHGR